MLSLTSVHSAPTQAFLDLYTIREELGTVQGLTITFIGDLLYGRPVHSLVYLLQHYHVKVQLVSPKALALPAKVRQQLVSAGQLLVESEALTKEIVAQSDVLYCTRVQKERFPSVEEYDKVKGAYRVDNATLKYAKREMIIMHPLPRNEEIAEEVDFDERAAYFRQVRLCRVSHSILRFDAFPGYLAWCRCVEHATRSSCTSFELRLTWSLDEIWPVLQDGSVGVGDVVKNRLAPQE